MGDMGDKKKRQWGTQDSCVKTSKRQKLNGQKSSIFLKQKAIELDRRGKLKISKRRQTIYSESDKIASVPGIDSTSTMPTRVQY